MFFEILKATQSMQTYRYLVTDINYSLEKIFLIIIAVSSSKGKMNNS